MGAHHSIRPTIHWQLLFRVRNRNKAERNLDEVRQVFAREIEDLSTTPYRKDPDLWECSFRTRGPSNPAPEVAFDCLMLAARLGNGWYLFGPGPDGRLDIFDGVFDVNRSGLPGIAGLAWASFQLAEDASEA